VRTRWSVFRRWHTGAGVDPKNPSRAGYRSAIPLVLWLVIGSGCGESAHVLATGGGPDGGGGSSASKGAGGSAGSKGSAGAADAGPASHCTPTAQTETQCSDGVDDDCDGYRDCLDPDCEGQTCGSGGDLKCTGGACIQPGNGLPALPRIDNVRVAQRGDTAIIDFEPVEGALDYRIYPMPKPEDVLIGEKGEVVVKNAIYRCGGDRPFKSRENDPGAGFDASLTAGNGNVIHDFVRKPEDAILGYVYLTPGTGRNPVYRMSDPNGGGGFQNADWVAPLYGECNRAEYVVGTDERDRLLAKGFRDDGIAFYTTDSATRPVYRRLYQNLWNGSPAVFYTDGAEKDAREKDDPTVVADTGERFRILDAQADGSVALHRVLYNGTNTFDVLAAGEPRYQRVLHQGNQPIWSLAWPGIQEKTTLVIEALDQGCPFAGGYVSSVHATADSFNFPSLTLQEARLTSGEVFINGQHEPTNRPRPVARAYVDVVPEAHPKMDWFEGFDPGETWDTFKVDAGNNGVHIFRNSKWALDFSGCTDNLTAGPMLGQMVTGYADGGSSCNMSMVPLGLGTTLKADGYLHVRMSSEVPSTGRRYPQIMITTTPVLNPGDVQPLDSVPLHARLGPMPFDKGAPPGDQRSIIVQPFGGYHELQVQFCDQRGWGVSAQCPQANIYGHHAGNYNETWKSPWLPVPLLGDVAGYDRPVQFDVYASTERVYVFMDDKPAGCAVLPAGKMPSGAVNVAFRGVLYHSGIDESVVPDDSGQQYLRRYSLSHFDRHMDDFGIDLSVPAPAWDESILPCGTRWYGGG
jgi:hypothetical protein